MAKYVKFLHHSISTVAVGLAQRLRLLGDKGALLGFFKRRVIKVSEAHLQRRLLGVVFMELIILIIKALSLFGALAYFDMVKLLVTIFGAGLSLVFFVL